MLCEECKEYEDGVCDECCDTHNICLNCLVYGQPCINCDQDEGIGLDDLPETS